MKNFNIEKHNKFLLLTTQSIVLFNCVIKIMNDRALYTKRKGKSAREKNFIRS